MNNERRYELRGIVRCIQWWLDNHSTQPNDVGALIQRHAAEKLDFHLPDGLAPCMDDLLAKAKSELEEPEIIKPKPKAKTKFQRMSKLRKELNAMSGADVERELDKVSMEKLKLDHINRIIKISGELGYFDAD